MVLKIIGIAESTYYYQKSHAESISTATHIGRPILDYSLDQSSKPVSDEQIKEWLPKVNKISETATQAVYQQEKGLSPVQGTKNIEKNNVKLRISIHED